MPKYAIHIERDYSDEGQFETFENHSQLTYRLDELLYDNSVEQVHVIEILSYEKKIRKVEWVSRV